MFNKLFLALVVALMTYSDKNLVLVQGLSETVSPVVEDKSGDSVVCISSHGPTNIF
jgi:hypothetical protein